MFSYRLAYPLLQRLDLNCSYSVYTHLYIYLQSMRSHSYHVSSSDVMPSNRESTASLSEILFDSYFNFFSIWNRLIRKLEYVQLCRFSKDKKKLLSIRNLKSWTFIIALLRMKSKKKVFFFALFTQNIHAAA